MSIEPTNNTEENIINIDELASRLIDRDIALADVSSELAAKVKVRAAQFSTNRGQLLASLPQVDSSSITGSSIKNGVELALQNSRIQIATQVKPRKFGMYIATLATAAALVAIVGVAITGSRTSDQSVSETGAVTESDIMATSDGPMARDMSAESFATETAEAAQSDAPSLSSPMATPSAPLDPINLTGEEGLRNLITSWITTGLVVSEKIIPVCGDANRPAIDALATFQGEAAEIHFTPQDGVVVYRISDCSVIIGIVP